MHPLNWPAETQYLVSLLAERWRQAHSEQGSRDRGSNTLEYIVIAAVAFGLAVTVMAVFSTKVREYMAKLG
ncbi:hypothetical protein [Actinomadura sp. 6N118]|uniref:hypothetical protein n=1 Tax=Actinomadura sp. 6N118 TaxID=3375151 RepID=UPI0037878343